ncbi:hypothetical protein FRB90_010338 [Tulasnella sp. 427]|nr:hypothetical protein FRB90_010338 [Tulasnella sp. 427]
MDSRGQPYVQPTHTSPRRSPDRQQQNFISPGSFHQFDDPSQTSSIIPQPLPPTSNSWQSPMSSVQVTRRNSDFNQFTPNMPQDPSYAVSPRSLSPQQVYQNSRHGASGLQEWDGSQGQAIGGHQPLAMSDEMPSQYRSQQYGSYDYQPSYQSEQQYPPYGVAAVTSTPSSSSSSGSPHAHEEKGYTLPSLQYPQPGQYAPTNPEYIARENYITPAEVGSNSYSGQQVGHVGEWRGSSGHSQPVYSTQVPIEPPTSFPLRQVVSPPSGGSFDTPYGASRRSPPEPPSSFRSPSPPRIAREPIDTRPRSESITSRRPSVDTVTASEQDYSSGGLPPQKPKRRRADAHQLRVLNEVYARTAFPSTEERIDLGRRLGMSPRQVQIWFQNRRQNAKAGRGPPLGTPSEYQQIPLHHGTPSIYREIVKTEQGDIAETRYGQPTSAYPGSRAIVTKREYE